MQQRARAQLPPSSRARLICAAIVIAAALFLFVLSAMLSSHDEIDRAHPLRARAHSEALGLDQRSSDTSLLESALASSLLDSNSADRALHGVESTDGINHFNRWGDAVPPWRRASRPRLVGTAAAGVLNLPNQKSKKKKIPSKNARPRPGGLTPSVAKPIVSQTIAPALQTAAPSKAAATAAPATQPPRPVMQATLIPAATVSVSLIHPQASTLAPTLTLNAISTVTPSPSVPASSASAPPSVASFSTMPSAAIPINNVPTTVAPIAALSPLPPTLPAPALSSLPSVAALTPLTPTTAPPSKAPIAAPAIFQPLASFSTTTTAAPLPATQPLVLFSATAAPPIATALSATAADTMPLFPDMAIPPFNPPPADSNTFKRPPLTLLRTPVESMDAAAAAAGKFPIAMVACNRPRLLERTLASLLALPGIERSTVTVFQDGTNADVANVAKSFLGVKLVQRPDGPISPGAERIAQHYKFTLTQVFERNPTAAYAIIVEDDMIFSPDFLAFFAHTYRLYEMDPSVYCISSWNDNGKRGLVKDANRLLRTEFFAGLGWLASRTLYKREFEQKWPSTHWDHWMRDPAQRKSRVCVYPEVSRNYNIGVRGTHSDDGLFKRYFALAHYNTLPTSAIRLTPVEALVKDSYNAAVGTLIHDALPVANMGQLARAPRGRAVVLYYRAHSSADAVWENVIAPLFGLWHSIPHIRGNLNGVQRFWWKDTYVFLVATYSPYAQQYMKKDAALFSGEPEETTQVSAGIVVLKAAIDQSCHDACRLHPSKLQCSHAHLRELNSCAIMRRLLGCSRCETQVGGQDQPVVTKDGVCLKNGGNDFSCSAHHPVTHRLCACRSP